MFLIQKLILSIHFIPKIGNKDTALSVYRFQLTHTVPGSTSSVNKLSRHTAAVCDRPICCTNVVHSHSQLHVRQIAQIIYYNQRCPSTSRPVSSTVLSGSASTARQHLQFLLYMSWYHQLFWLTPVKHTYIKECAISTTSYCQHLPSKLKSAVVFTKTLKHIRQNVLLELLSFMQLYAKKEFHHHRELRNHYQLRLGSHENPIHKNIIKMEVMDTRSTSYHVTSAFGTRYKLRLQRLQLHLQLSGSGSVSA